MNISNHTVVTISFKLFDAGGRLIEQSHRPFAYLHGGHFGVFPKVEAALNGKQAGDSISVALDPEDAFGEYDDEWVHIAPASVLPPNAAVGGQIIAEQDGHEIVWRITRIADGKATLDSNHELAGQRLRYDATVLDVRTATQDEIAHGHIHNDDDYEHHH